MLGSRRFRCRFSALLRTRSLFHPSLSRQSICPAAILGGLVRSQHFAYPTVTPFGMTYAASTAASSSRQTRERQGTQLSESSGVWLMVCTRMGRNGPICKEPRLKFVAIWLTSRRSSFIRHYDSPSNRKRSGTLLSPLGQSAQVRTKFSLCARASRLAKGAHHQRAVFARLPSLETGLFYPGV